MKPSKPWHTDKSLPKAIQATKTKDGTIRKGQRKAFRRAPNSEIELRVIHCASLLRRGKTNFQIHEVMCPKYDITWSNVDAIYIPRAKKYLKERTSVTVEQAKNKGLDMLFKIMEDPLSSDMAKIAAERRVAEITGYNAPTKIAQTNPEGTESYQPLVIAVTADELPKPKKV